MDHVRKASEQAIALGGPQIKSGEPWSQLGGPQSQLGGPQSQLREPQSQLGGPQSQVGGPGEGGGWEINGALLVCGGTIGHRPRRVHMRTTFKQIKLERKLEERQNLSNSSIRLEAVRM